MVGFEGGLFSISNAMQKTTKGGLVSMQRGLAGNVAASHSDGGSSASDLGEVGGGATPLM